MTINIEPDRALNGSIEPSFFRKESHQLYACHHYPMSMSTVRDADATLICNSVGFEYDRCHRALRQLAVQLAKSGRHAMRFDYYGCGDSAGEYAQALVEQWRADVADAIDECRRLSVRERVCVVGVRLGANLAAQVAAQRKDVDRLVLYAPVGNKQAMLDEWERECRKKASSHSFPSESFSEEVLGYPFTDAFQSELDKVFVLPEPGSSLRHVLILSDPAFEGVSQVLAQSLGKRGARVSVESFNDIAIWNRDPSESLVPFKLLRRIVGWMNENP